MIVDVIEFKNVDLILKRFNVYYPPEVSGGKYWGLGVLHQEMKLLHYNCISMHIVG